MEKTTELKKGTCPKCGKDSLKSVIIVSDGKWVLRKECDNPECKRRD